MVSTWHREEARITGAEPVRGRPMTRDKRQQGPDLERLLDNGKEPRAL